MHDFRLSHTYLAVHTMLCAAAVQRSDRMVASLRTADERQAAVAAVTHAICPGGIPALLNMLGSSSSNVRSDAIRRSGLLIDRLGVAFAVDAVKAGLAQALVKLL